jgi:uncharacterized membrane protein
MILTLIVALSLAFVVTHLGLSHGRVRQGLVSSLGVWPFRGLYSLVSFLTLGPAAVLWWQHRHLGAVLWELPWWPERIVAAILVLIALLLFFQSLATPSPSSMAPAKLEVRGVLRITRHPMNMALAGWGLAHMLANGTVGDVAFFGSFVVVGVFGAYHMDARLRRQKGPEFTLFCNQTSVLPFGAIVRGRNRLAADELSFPLAAMAIAAFLILVLFHGRWFGGELF